MHEGFAAEPGREDHPMARHGVDAPAADLDAVVVGAGPNGLTAAARLARAGRSVLVVEAGPTIGGSCRSAALTETGFVHDVGAGFVPFAVASRAFAELGVWDRVDLVHPDVTFAHPLDGEPAAIAHRDLDRTVAGLGTDGRRWRRLLAPIAERWTDLVDEIHQPVLHRPDHPWLLARFGRLGVRSALSLSSGFGTDAAAALLGGCAAHAGAALDRSLTGGLALALAGAGHAVGWPVVRRGSGRLTEALAAIVTEHGGRIECGRPIHRATELPSARVVLFDTSPRQVATIAGAGLPGRGGRALQRFVPGPGIVKVDYALHQPVPWSDPEVGAAGTVHVGGTVLEIAAALDTVRDGGLPGAPYVLVGQQSVVDPTRAPEGAHTLWAYTHVPQGIVYDTATVDGVVARMEAQIERFAPGFADAVRARHVTDPDAAERAQPNRHGGELSGGEVSARRIVARPRLALDPWRIPGAPDRRAVGGPAAQGWYLASASAAPGPGVHGMAGWHAAGSALRHDLT
jgi:phytoene dehydrogenase-like protein